MSIMQRLLRAFETAANVELSDKDRGGMWGEQYAEDIIDRTHNIPYARIQKITLQRATGLSAYDEMTVTYLNGSSQSFRCAGGEIHLNRFQGEQQTHKLRNINQILIGVANKK